MLDSGAARISLAGEPQVQALQKKDLIIQLDTAAAGSNTIRFGKDTATVKGVV
jgi:allantoicase